MSYQPAEHLTNRTFVGLIIAQFLAGFNDQAIHAAAMFYAMHTKILSQANAITLMPILFYAPWAIFCTLAGYYADRYSKTMTLRLWKLSEVVIALILLAGFYLGTNAGMPHVGGWIVMSCVFMMGTHAAFFAPAKYGAMPEILRSHILSRGNGILESTTFLASILGTVSGGLLFSQFRNNEVWIGVILLFLSVIGAAASFMIVWLPAASPDKRFPTNLFKPLVDNLKVMFRSRPLALAMLGIAFFIFMVAYMRAAMYMHGETRNPRWDEQQTSLIVATVALGVGLGSPLAGYLSGGKIELGLVPLGCLGMIFALLIAAFALEHTAVLVIALIIIGFFSGFYMVPLYTLLQQRAPKKSKGELVATSNFINVTGAIAASILFKALVLIGILTQITPKIAVKDNVAAGVLQKPVMDHHGKITKANVVTPDGAVIKFRAKHAPSDPQEADGFQNFVDMLGIDMNLEPAERQIHFDDNFFDILSGMPREGDEVIVASYKLRGVEHFLIRRADQPLGDQYDTEILPRYLFIGAALMTFGILLLLCRKLPDFFVRSLFWFKTLGKFRLRAVGMQHLPTEGPVILVTNCQDMHSCLQLVSATDRTTKVILIDDDKTIHDGALLRTLAQRVNLIIVRPDSEGQAPWLQAKLEAFRTLQAGHLLAISLVHEEYADAIAVLLRQLRSETGAPMLPVYCGSLDDGALGVTPRVRVVFGEIMTKARPVPDSTAIHAGAPLSTAIQTMQAEDGTLANCKTAIDDLGEWIRENDDREGSDQH
jgi:MFS family permease